jgi:hypothetical protein
VIYKSNVVYHCCLWCVGKSGSFGFAEVSDCVSGKAKCATCAVAEIQFFLRCGVLFFLGSACVSPSWSAGLCRETAKLSAEFGHAKSLVKMSKVDGLGISLMVVVSFFRLAYNGLGLFEGGDFHHKCSCEEQMLNFVQMFPRSTEPPLLPNLFFGLVFSLQLIGSSSNSCKILSVFSITNSVF